MEAGRVVKIGYYVDPYYLTSEEKFLEHLSAKTNIKGRILFTLRDFLLKQSKTFDDAIIHYSYEQTYRYSDGTLTGLLRDLIRSEADIGVSELIMNDQISQVVDFAYPFGMSYHTFMIQTPEYNPKIFGIFQTFSLSVWIAIISAFIVMSLVYYVSFKSKYPLNKILLHTLAVFLRQDSIIRPATLAETLLVYSWVLGAMIICLAYDSVFLSFLAFPPVMGIKDVSDLASAVKNGDYHCIADPGDAIYYQLRFSKREDIKIIAKDISSNNISYDDTFADFILERKKLKLALITYAVNIEHLSFGKKFASEDHLFETMFGMMVRKGFCCKNLLDIFVHRLMASGLYYKYYNDRNFLIRLRILLDLPEKEASIKRKLTLIDVAPAFIFLLTGYILSFLVLTWEILTNLKKRKYLKKIKPKKMFL